MKLNLKLIFRHILFWVGYTLYQLLSNSWQKNDQVYLSVDEANLSYIAVVIILAYINIYFLLPNFADSRKYVGYFFCVLILLLVGGTAQRLLTYAVWTPWEKLHDAKAYLGEPKEFFVPVRILRNAFRIFPAIAITTLIELMKRAYDREVQLRALGDEKHHVEIDFLKSQINPHFFFNTLNSLYALSLKGSALTTELILQLSELMHFTLYQSAKAKVLLSEDIANLQKYIAVEQIRFDDFGEISFDFPDTFGDIMVPPLLFIPFVENAFKHGIPDQTGWIKIEILLSEKQLKYQVSNTFSVNESPKKGGLGLKNLYKRLELSYPKQHQIFHKKENGIYEAYLILNL